MTAWENHGNHPLMNFTVTETGAACGAFIDKIDLREKLGSTTITALRQQWLKSHVLIFPNQQLTDDDLERFSQYFGAFGHDPFISPIDGRDHVIAVERRVDEQAPVFAEVWHTDWSFQKVPPAGTCLYSITIPPTGGDTGFVNQHKALTEMPGELRTRLEGKMAIHSAASGYSPDGIFGNEEAEADRSMRIVVSDDARATQTHPLIRSHPETGSEGLYGCVGYIAGIEGMNDQAARELLMEMYAWQTREEFQYMHTWQENMLVMWDNRSVLHKANGGYDGHNRLLHRTTIADRVAA